MLGKDGFVVIEMGDLIREKMRELGEAMTHENVREFSRMQREKYGNDVVARYMVAKLRKLKLAKAKDIAIMGIRSTYELDYIQKRVKGITIIALSAGMLERFHRLKERHKPEDPQTLKEFRWLEQREKQGFLAQKSEERHGVLHVIQRADYVILNNKDITDLKKNLEMTLEHIRKEE
jgi:dephospho-CoA kinase